jgi:uncharacterized protein YggE
VRRAREDADVAARAAGGSLGPLAELTIADFDVPRVMAYAAAKVRGMAAEMAPPMEPGLQEVRVGVTTRWQFMAGR